MKKVISKNMKKLANEIVTWLKNYADNNERKAFVVGVSGGVDSALVSTLCAMTGVTTYCVVLPCQSKDDGIKMAEDHIRNLKKKYANVQDVYMDLTSTFSLYEANVPAVFRYGEKGDLTFANTKSRLRMIALYQVAGITHGCVVGTGNKVEDFGVGFFTKYGDGGVDISPIADLTKTEVRKMARALGISKKIITVAPTDGLWADNRTDESALGATYEELEWAMKWLEDGKDCYSTVLVEGLTKRQKEVLDIYNKRHTISRHKLDPIPTFKRTEPPRMSYEAYAALKKLIEREQARLTEHFQIACWFLPTEKYKAGQKSTVEKIHDVFSKHYGELNRMQKELHAAVASTYKDHANPKMKQFWGVE